MAEWVKLDEVKAILDRLDRYPVMDFVMIDVVDLEVAIDHLEEYSTDDITGWREP